MKLLLIAHLRAIVIGYACREPTAKSGSILDMLVGETFGQEPEHKSSGFHDPQLKTWEEAEFKIGEA